MVKFVKRHRTEIERLPAAFLCGAGRRDGGATRQDVGCCAYVGRKVFQANWLAHEAREAGRGWASLHKLQSADSVRHETKL
jgi:hypothetical protein